MTVTNIIDERKRKYRWKKICAVVEPAWHDNKCKDSDHADRTEADESWFGYDAIEDVTIEEAIKWAQTKPGEVTLYLLNTDQVYYTDAQGVRYERIYDKDGNRCLIDPKTHEHIPDPEDDAAVLDALCSGWGRREQ